MKENNGRGRRKETRKTKKKKGANCSRLIRIQYFSLGEPLNYGF